ncbi:CU044_5270 family protein [Kribbella sp. NBC_00709]|uniref:CU044_5270 family protein n=1 Tax=Kribbella sp. NBC_00709 TaxID=2975972 RepID=UPI002E28BDC0|nr:CU044_5270 family protein [Kribbella sp. NBC_00709]
MNEFDVLRKAFPETDGPTPETTDAARRQVEELIHEARPARSFMSFVRAGWLGTAVTAATALVAVAGLGGALVVGRGGGGSQPSGPATTTAPRLTAAAEVLIAAAVRQEKDEKVSGTYYRVRSLQLNPTTQVGNPKYTLERRSITESWMPMKPGVESSFGWVNLGYQLVSPADAAKWRAQGSPTSWQLPYERTPISMSDGVPVVNKMSFRDVPPGYYLTGDKPLSAEQIAALPTDPVQLRAYLGRSVGTDLSPADREYAVFAAAGRLLFEMPAPPKLRGAALRVLAALPGTHVRTGVKDPLGRVGTEVSITTALRKAGSAPTSLFWTGATYIIDPATGRLLSSTIGGPKPGSTVVLESGWTDDRPTPPSTAVR